MRCWDKTDEQGIPAKVKPNKAAAAAAQVAIQAAAAARAAAALQESGSLLPMIIVG